VKHRVRFEDDADVEYRLAGRWYEEHRSNLGIEFFDAVDATIGQIVELPSAGSPVALLPADVPARKIAVPRFPYDVIYLTTDREIRILAVAHDRRKPGYWKARFP